MENYDFLLEPKELAPLSVGPLVVFTVIYTVFLLISSSKHAPNVWTGPFFVMSLTKLS
jgi:hypothetical protein